MCKNAYLGYTSNVCMYPGNRKCLHLVILQTKPFKCSYNYICMYNHIYRTICYNRMYNKITYNVQYNYIINTYKWIKEICSNGYIQGVHLRVFDYSYIVLAHVEYDTGVTNYVSICCVAYYETPRAIVLPLVF